MRNVSPQFEAALRLFDEENARDPNQEMVGGIARPRELVYAERVTEWVLKLSPNASEALLLAARSQHLCRWEIPRSRYPEGRSGYLRWRSALKQFHADRSAEVLRQTGYGEEMVARVRSLNLKADFPEDPESRLLEDALCLVFLQHQFGDLARRTEESKMVNVLRKSWAKMTDQARAEALKLPFNELDQTLLDKALPPAH
jgi:hypothetical protein